MPSPSTTTHRTALFLAAGVLSGEALAAVAFGLVEIPNIRASRLVVGLGVTLLMVGYGGCLLLLARGIGLGRRWARGPAVATQLLQGLMAYSFRSGPTWWVGLALGVAALVVLGCLLARSATAVFEPPEAE